jgi:hypothetical protein
MDRKGLAILVLAAVILLLLVSPRRSGYAAAKSGPTGFNLGNTMYSGAGAMGVQERSSGGETGVQGSAGLMPVDFSAGAGKPAPATSAALIPREVVQTEDFGQFSPDAILSGQNYLDPRSQIGYPETLGGNLRNANRDFRSEPLNPRTPVSIFNLSTIPPDVMRPKFEIDNEYQ